MKKSLNFLKIIKMKKYKYLTSDTIFDFKKKIE